MKECEGRWAFHRLSRDDFDDIFSLLSEWQDSHDDIFGIQEEEQGIRFLLEHAKSFPWMAGSSPSTAA